MNTATLVRANLPGFQGDASLYRMDPPLAGYSFDDEAPAPRYEYVIASAARVPYSGAETYLFGADADGKVVEWTELPGSQKGTMSHADALVDAGYTVV